METNANQTIIGNDGKILIFGTDHFINDIVQGDCCFICGAKPNRKEFNNELVIPDWILRKYDNFSDKIFLPGGQIIQQKDFKIPCCSDCNIGLKENYEKPISELLRKPCHEINEIIESQPEVLFLLFKWISLIFLKAHLKERAHNISTDEKKSAFLISEACFWKDMQHIHSIVRSYYTGAKVNMNVMGTILILPVGLFDGDELFDFSGNLTSKTIMIRLGSTAVLAVLDDSHGCLGLIKDTLNKINTPVSILQNLEILSVLIFLNLNLKFRPKYHSTISDSDNYQIYAEIPAFSSLVEDKEILGSHGIYLEELVENIFGRSGNNGQILSEVRNGNGSFLLNNKGNFVSHGPFGFNEKDNNYYRLGIG